MNVTMDDVLNGPYGSVQFAVQYGSGVSDMDVLAVYEHEPPMTEIVTGRMDILALSSRSFVHLLSVLDPCVTEPILSGTLLIGDRRACEEARSRLSSVSRTDQAFTHLLQRSASSYESSIKWFDLLSTASHPGVFRAFHKNLSWAISYYAFAQFYSSNPSCSGAVRLPVVVSQMEAALKLIWESPGQSGSRAFCGAQVRRWETFSKTECPTSKK